MTHLYNDRRKILLIDQNTIKQKVRATILRNYEIEVHTANSVAEAASLSTKHTYDLVLLAAQADSEEAAALSAQIRASRPRQRIGLLVGPPTFVRELGGMRREAARKKVVSIQDSTSRAVETSSPLSSSPHVSSPQSSPQWQEMIRKLLSDWYVDRNTLLGSAS
jgi:CheY-like chemotaxis protein